MRRFSSRLVARVVFIVVIVIVPALAIIVYDQGNERRHAREDALSNASRLANFAATEESGSLSDAQRLLATLSTVPALRGDNRAACQEFLQTIVRDHPDYINMLVANPNGGLVCSAAPVAGRASGRPAWFSRVIEARTPIISDYQRSLTNGQPAVVVAHPVLDSAGQVQRVVAAVVSLEELNAVFKTVQLPQGATLTLTDRQGIILARAPEGAAWIGRRHAQFAADRAAGSDTQRRMRESRGSDGVLRLYTVVPVGAGGATGLFVTLDIESAAIFAQADQLLVGHLWLLGIFTIGALIVALVGGRLLVLQPMKARERETEDRMRFALEVSRVGVWEHHGTNDRVFWSDTLAAMHGIEPGVFAGNVGGFLACVEPDERAAIQDAIGGAISNQKSPLTVEYTTIWPDGMRRRLSTTAHYSYDDAGTLTRGAGVTVDVTEQRSLEDQLRQAQKMEAVGQLAGGVAHDFNNMLTAILGNAQFLADGLPPGDPRQTDIDEIAKAAQRAAGLTQQLLAFSRKQLLAPRVLRLGDVIGQMAPMLRRLLGETVELRTTMGDRSDIKADAGQIGQVVMNLAVNARDAMKSGGRLSVETSDITLTAADVREFPEMLPGRYVLLTVTDTGHGMDAGTRARIFEPFFTTKPVGEGTGLGLATVYGIVKQSGGHISVMSETGGGTTFRICLPQTNERAPFDESTVPATLPRGSESVLVVEDEPLVREFAAKVLTRLGYQVQAVESAAEAIRYLDAEKGRVDLIVTDVVLPVMSGPAMAAVLQDRGIAPAIIYMSGYTDDASLREGATRKGGLFLQKPFTGETLAVAVRDVLDAIPVA